MRKLPQIVPCPEGCSCSDCEGYVTPRWLRVLYRLDYQVFCCRWGWFCDWVHNMQDIRRINWRRAKRGQAPL